MLIIAKNGGISAKRCMTKDGKEFYVLEKNYKNKDGKWDSYSFSISPYDICAISEVVERLKNHIISDETIKANERIADKQGGGAKADENMPF